MHHFGQLVFLGFLMFIIIKLFKGEKIKLGKMILWAFLLVIFFPFLVPFLALFGIIVAGTALTIIIVVMVIVTVLAILFA
jgi:hypothetical protein